MSILYFIMPHIFQFQRTIEQLFKDIPYGVMYFDNIFISGANDEEHLKNVNSVLNINNEEV